MKKSKFTESPIIKALKENEAGRWVEEISRELGINKGTFYNWRKKYGGMEVYRAEGLERRQKKRRKLPEELRKRLYQPSRVNEIWSMDFMSDSLSDGRAFRVLNVIDDCSRECLLSQWSVLVFHQDE